MIMQIEYKNIIINSCLYILKLFVATTPSHLFTSPASASASPCHSPRFKDKYKITFLHLQCSTKTRQQQQHQRKLSI